MTVRHAVLAVALGTMMLGCQKAPPPAAPKAEAPRFKLTDSKAELTRDPKTKKGTLLVTTGPSTTVVVKSEKFGQVDDATTDASGKAKFSLIEGQLPPGKNQFTVELSNPFGAKHTLSVELEVAAPTLLVLKPKEADEKVPLDQIAVTSCVGTLEAAEEVAFSSTGTGRQLRAARTLAFDAELPEVSALELDGQAVPVQTGKASFVVEPLKHLAAVSAADAVDANGVSFNVPLKLTFKGQALTGGLSCKTALPAALLEGVAKVPVLLPGESAARKGRKVLVAPEVGKVWGSGTLTDIDLVLLTVPQDVVVGTCEYLSKTGERSSGKRTRVDTVASVYERRTGKRVGTKTFQGGEPECKSKVVGEESRSAVGSAAWGNAETWAFDFLDK